MRANHANKTIEMTAKEEKAAGKIKSAAFNELMELKAMLPGYEVAIVAAPRRKKSAYSGLTYEYMEAYIEKHDDKKKTIMVEFNKLRAIVSDEDKKNLGGMSETLKAASYGEIREWFLNTFVEIKEFHEKHNKEVEEILKSKKKKAA